MTNSRIAGTVLLVLGAILLFVGYQASQSAGEQLRQTFAGGFSEQTTWYLVLGAGASLGGLLLLVFRR